MPPAPGPAFAVAMIPGFFIVADALEAVEHVAIAVGVPYFYSTFGIDSTTELAAPNPSSLRPLPDSAFRLDNASNIQTEPANAKADKDRKQTTQIASRKR